MLVGLAVVRRTVDSAGCHTIEAAGIAGLVDCRIAGWAAVHIADRAVVRHTVDSARAVRHTADLADWAVAVGWAMLDRFRRDSWNSP